jgi:Putative esterase
VKRNTLCLALLVTLMVSAPVWADGTVEETVFYSNALGEDRTALVYLPDGYDTSGEAYPVMYYLGGVGCMAGNWCSAESGHRIHTALDEMIGAGQIEPLIFVEIDPGSFPWAPDLPMNSFLADSELNGNHETAVIEDLVPWIDTNFRTLADREHRFVAARCVGSLGAARLALRHSELFAGFATSVGSGAVEGLPYMIGLILADYPEGPPYEYSPVAGEWSYFLFMWSAALSPNMTNPPWYIDLPLDDQGNLIPDVFDRFMDHSFGRFAAEFATTGRQTRIFMLGGAADPLYLPQTMIFAANLDATGVPYTLRIDGGDHDDPPEFERFRSHITFFMPLNATVELSPRIIDRRHWWSLVQATIELPGDLDIADIVTTTLAITQINGSDLDHPIRALVANEISDLNGNGRDDLTVWFWNPLVVRAASAMGIENNEPFDVTIQGETTSFLFLTATDEQRAVNMRAPGMIHHPWPIGID